MHTRKHFQEIIQEVKQYFFCSVIIIYAASLKLGIRSVNLNSDSLTIYVQLYLVSLIQKSLKKSLSVDFDKKYEESY